MKRNIILSLLTVLLMTVSGTVSAQPDESLARHNFFYAGQSKRLRMFIVKDGQVSWAHEYKGRGEISDAVLLTGTAMPSGAMMLLRDARFTPYSL